MGSLLKAHSWGRPAAAALSRSACFCRTIASCWLHTPKSLVSARIPSFSQNARFSAAISRSSWIFALASVAGAETKVAYAPNDSSTTMNNENRSREPALLSMALALTSVIVEFLSNGFQDEIFAVRFPTLGTWPHAPAPGAQEQLRWIMGAFLTRA